MGQTLLYYINGQDDQALFTLGRILVDAGVYSQEELLAEYGPGPMYSGPQLWSFQAAGYRFWHEYLRSLQSLSDLTEADRSATADLLVDTYDQGDVNLTLSQYNQGYEDWESAATLNQNYNFAVLLGLNVHR